MPPVAASGLANQGRYPFQVDNPFVVAFLDRKAAQKIGILPVGTGFAPVARSYFEFSNMMRVQGDGFQVFVDYTTNRLHTDQFPDLPRGGGGGGLVGDMVGGTGRKGAARGRRAGGV